MSASLTHPLVRENAAGERRVNLIQGQQHVSADPAVVLTTLLGSCVAACLRDPVAGVGGMNHFLLPGREGGNDAAAMQYGVHAMELLVNELLRRGAQRHRLEAKLFGGAAMMAGLNNIGEQNAAFAERFLANEGLAMVGGSLRGNQGRRLQYWPVTGRARQSLMVKDRETLFRREREVEPAPIAPTGGSIELF